MNLETLSRIFPKPINYKGMKYSPYLASREINRIVRYKAEPLQILNKKIFLARWKKCWWKRGYEKEYLVTALALATMGSSRILKYLQPEDMIYGKAWNMIHVKDYGKGSGQLLHVHPALFTVLDLYFRRHYRGQKWPFRYQRGLAIRRHFGPLNSIRLMEIRYAN